MLGMQHTRKDNLSTEGFCSVCRSALSSVCSSPSPKLLARGRHFHQLGGAHSQTFKLVSACRTSGLHF